MVVHDPHKPLPQDARVTDLTRLAAIPLFRPLGLVARGKLLESGRILAGPCRETLEGPAALVVVLDGEAEIHSRYLETANGPDLMTGRASEASRASFSARGPGDVRDAQMPRRPGMAGSGLDPI